MEAGRLDRTGVLSALNRILEVELAGVVRYTHYSFMIFGINRMPIMGWLREQARASLQLAEQAGEWVTTLGGHPSLAVGPLLESQKHLLNDILRELLDHKMMGLEIYRELLALVKDRSVALEEFTRVQIALEERHLAEVQKMLRPQG